MPYIRKDTREDLDLDIEVLCSSIADEQVGSYNYTITKLLQQYLQDNGESYSSYNDLIGMLECCKLELYRRRVAKYEDKKIKENGDVY